MRRFVGTLLDILILSAVVLGIIALWGLLPTESRDELAVTVKETQGQASALPPGQRNERAIGKLTSLNPGSRLNIPAGGDAFLFIHTQLNKQKSVMALTPQIYITFAVAIVLGGAAQIYTLRQRAKELAATRAAEITPRA